jgi:hypothetical protein
MTAFKQITWYKVQQTLWVVLGVGCLFAALVFWAINDRDEWREVSKNNEQETEIPIEPEKVAVTQHLGMMHEVVKPLDMTQRVVVTAQHEAEFRGTKFIQEHQQKYTIELLRVSNEAIIKSFLKKQNQRRDFSYIRLSGEQQVEQYVLLYKTYANINIAKQALADLDLALPKSISPIIQKVEVYQPYVNDLGSDELATGQKVYEVKLKSAPVPKVDTSRLAEHPQPSAEAKNESRLPATSTTVTRRDENGNVIDVQRSDSNTHQNDQSGSNAVQQITDPFN